MACRILFGGMIGSGKSTLVCSIYEQLLRVGTDVALYELDVWSDTHDCILGRKPWDERNKRGHDDSDSMHVEFAERLEEYADDEHDIVLGDLPGRVENRSFPLLTGVADHGVLITRAPCERDKSGYYAGTAEDWHQLMRGWGISAPTYVHSIRDGEPLRFGRICINGLERTPMPDHPAIEELSGMLLVRSLVKRSGPALDALEQPA